VLSSNEPRASLLTLRQVAQLLQITPRGVRDLVARSKLPRPMKVGRLLRWSPATIDQWIGQQEKQL